jgi:hypothetical protein
MSNIGYRKKGESGPFYHPERDYAYITPELMCGAIDRFAAELDSFPEERQWCEEHKIKKEELAQAVQVLVQAHKDFINATNPVASFDEALTRYKFKDIRLAVRQFLFATFGFIFCAAWFKAVRHVSVVGEESPAQDAMAQFSAVAREFANNCAVPAVPDTDRDVLWLQRDVLLSQVSQLLEENARLQRYILDLTPVLPPPTTWLEKVWRVFRSISTGRTYAKIQNVQRPDAVCHETGKSG